MNVEWMSTEELIDEMEFRVAEALAAGANIFEDDTLAQMYLCVKRHRDYEAADERTLADKYDQFRGGVDINERIRASRLRKGEIIRKPAVEPVEHETIDVEPLSPKEQAREAKEQAKRSKKVWFAKED